VGGYEEMLEILADPAHEEYRQTKTWAGKNYAPEKFNLAATNRALRRLDRRQRAPRRRTGARA
jgi:hypothetical protein